MSEAVKRVPEHVFSFMPDGGSTGALLRSIDWAKHALGPPDNWSPALKTTLGIIFGSRHPMFLWWGNDLIQFYNDAYLPSFGRGKHPDAMGQPGRVCWPEIWDIIYPQIDDVLRRGVASWNEDQLVPIHRNGKLEDVYWTYGYSPVREASGEIAGVLVVCTETTTKVIVTEELRKNQAVLLDNERELRYARQELESFILQAPVGIAILRGPQHTYTLINPAFITTLFGNRPVEDLLNKPVRVALPELKGQGYFEILDEVYQTGKSFLGTKLRASFRVEPGIEKEMFINFSYQAKRDRDGKIDGILAVVYEVTDQVNEQKEIERLAENLRAAIIARDSFLAIASHELNTPLTSLKLQTQMSKRLLEKQGIGVFTPEKLTKFLDNTILQTDRLSRLVNDMLDVARLHSDKLTMSYADTNLSQLVEEVLERFVPQLEAARCDLELDISPDIIAPLDAFRIEQVITNFITNAIKYAPGKRVAVRVEKSATTARVSFRDEGSGIPFEHQERIFGQFERAVGSNDLGGLGLGLYICKQIVEQHKGKIYVMSDVGLGATFSFEIPLTIEGAANV